MGHHRIHRLHSRSCLPEEFVVVFGVVQSFLLLIIEITLGRLPRRIPLGLLVIGILPLIRLASRRRAHLLLHSLDCQQPLVRLCLFRRAQWLQELHVIEGHQEVAVIWIHLSRALLFEHFLVLLLIHEDPELLQLLGRQPQLLGPLIIIVK